MIKVTILILIDGFLQYVVSFVLGFVSVCHNPYFNRWFSAIISYAYTHNIELEVTILILIDGFLQYEQEKINKEDKIGHNPYFNRWFSAISLKARNIPFKYCHNPYFNRWFSAIKKKKLIKEWLHESQSLF